MEPLSMGRGGTVDGGTSGPDNDYGAGRLDAYAALRSAGAPSALAFDARAHLSEGTLSGTGAQSSTTSRSTTRSSRSRRR